MSAGPDVLSATTPRKWLLPGVLTGAVLLLLAAMYWPTLQSMIDVWGRSETFAHGYLVFPISAWLIWRMRDRLARITPTPDLRGLLLLAGAGAAWLLADAGSVNVVAQYAFVTILISAVWTLLGASFLRAAFFPLMFLFFAVPVGEFLIEPLMRLTADFTVAMLRLSGIPVYREGTFFSIPTGDWSVVEGCSGLRYLIASVTLGVVYAYLTYRSWTRRVLFTLAAVIVPILANSGRAYLIVMIAHLSDMKLALGVDHYIYGWVFFGLVMLLLFWMGSFWREDETPPAPGAAGDPEPTTDSGRGLASCAVLVLVLAGVWPAYGAWLASRPLPEMAALELETRSGWQPVAPFTSWQPHWVGADRQLRESYAQAGRKVLLALDYYATQRQDAELVNSQNLLVRQKDADWVKVGEATVTADTGRGLQQVRQARLRGRDGQRLLVWQWNLIDGQSVVNDHLAKLRLAVERVRLQRDDGLSVLIATPYEEGGAEAAAQTLARFAADMAPAIEQAVARLGGS